MSFLRSFLFCAVFVGAASQGHAQANARDQLRARATEAIAFSRGGQYEKYLDTVYPDALQALGGREKMAAMMKQAVEDIKHEGFSFESTDIGEPSEPASGGSKLFSVIPTKIHLIGPKVKIEVSNYLLAISVDHGQTWKFLDGSGLTQGTIQQLIPDFPATLKLPEPKQPKVIPLP